MPLLQLDFPSPLGKQPRRPAGQGEPSSPGLRAILWQSLRWLWAIEKFGYSLRVLIALAVVMAGCWLADGMAEMIPLFLGVIAAALAETDDPWQGRAKASVVIVVLFAVSALLVAGFARNPPLFVLAMIGSTFVLTMSGALGDRYATIAHATLTLGVYTMLGLEQTGGPRTLWYQPLLLSLGAAWYCLLSVLWQAAFADQPAQQGLAALFERIGGYLESKAQLFEPVRRADIKAARMALAQRNGTVVIALNQVKDLIRRRRREGVVSAHLERYLRLFFLAQDIHERASSAHYPYEAYTEAFFHSDVMFRCQRLLYQQGQACRALGRAIRRQQPFAYAESASALADMEDAVAYLRASRPDLAEQRGMLRGLGDLLGNLTSLERTLALANEPERLGTHRDASLFDETPRSLADAWARIRRNLTPISPVFRHALRLTVALSAGYALKHFVQPAIGYWILLTILFVCLPNYASTRRRLWQRMAGTVFGLIAGWALITLFPQAPVQRSIAVAAGVAFFVWRTDRYALATGAITVLVVCCFNQVVNGYEIIWPRLVDTLLGCLVSGLVIFLILPDWRGRQLHRMAADSLSSSSAYLRALMAQYRRGKDDDLAYRLARRNAHAADAQLSQSLSNTLQEPGRFRHDAEAGLRFLVTSHALLGHLSALGAHRQALPPGPDETLIAWATEHAATSLGGIAGDMVARRPTASSPTDEALAGELEAVPEGIDDTRRLVRTQLAQICRQIAVIRQQAGAMTMSATAAS